MAKPIKSQWNFGELFPVEQTRKVFSVTELTSRVRRLLEKEFGQVWVSGEITNLRRQTSGHLYFTLKDASAQLSCVLFRGESQVDRTLLQDGRKVTLGGELTVYEPRGQYQLRVTAAELEGLGALQAAFERLKQKLKAEGLFDPQRKRPLPRYPRRIGLVTSPTGAAIRDVLHVIARRDPSLEIILAQCRVQGDGAAEEVAAAIRLLNEFNALPPRELPGAAPSGDSAGVGCGLDLILVTRGGGSLEDLWAFNEEVVARAIFESSLAVVSAVGHEIDFTISDFVADVRAATPSAAAEIITEGVYSSVPFIAEARERLSRAAGQQLTDKRGALEEVERRLARVHPRRRLELWVQRLDDLQGGLVRCARQGLRGQQVAWRNLAERLSRVRPAVMLRRKRENLEVTSRRLQEQVLRQLEEARHRLLNLESRLRLLGPQQVLGRGYSITMDEETGQVVREAARLQSGQWIKTHLKEGEVRSQVAK
jgi:exodeoxyribonuclease VII large subunit